MMQRLRSTRWTIAIGLALSALAPVSRSTVAADTSLADAAEKADWPRVSSLLKNHGDVNTPQADGATALEWAVYHDKVDAATQLLAAGADAKLANRYGVTPLSLACTNGDAELVKALLKAGADANTTTMPSGETVLMTASRTGRVEPVRALLEAGAKIEATDRKGQTALMWAADEDHADVVSLLVQSGANMHARLKSGFTPMLFAVRDGKMNVVRTLLKSGVDANEAIEPPAKKDGTPPKNVTPALILAIENGHYELALELVKAGANPNDQRSSFGPLHTLTWARKPNRGDDPDGQPPPTGSGNLTSLQFAKLLVEHGADVNLRLAKGPGGRGKLGMTGATPFLMASKTADLPYMELLISLGADPLTPNKDGCTPIMAAAGIGVLAPDEEAGTEEESIAAVDYLLHKNGDLNNVDKNGETAMHGAAYKSLPKMVQFLADHGAKIDAWNHKDKYGWTPLLIAQGYRPGNFKPAEETIEAMEKVMRDAGVTPPPPPARSTTNPAGYDNPETAKAR